MKRLLTTILSFFGMNFQKEKNQVLDSKKLDLPVRQMKNMFSHMPRRRKKSRLKKHIFHKNHFGTFSPIKSY